jgi:hypothetical protein
VRLHPVEAAVDETKNMNVNRQAITNKKRSRHPFILLARIHVPVTLPRKCFRKLYINYENTEFNQPLSIHQMDIDTF